MQEATEDIAVELDESVIKGIAKDIINVDECFMEKIVQQKDRLREISLFLPPQLSQLTINNSHSSNASIIIALLSGYTVANVKIFCTVAFESLVSEVLPSFLGSTNIGNHLYQYHNCHVFCSWYRD